MAAAEAGFPAWASTPGEQRASALERAAELLEHHRGELLALLQNEGGKTLDDALSEVREATDYCRYYAAQARGRLAVQTLPAPPAKAMCCAIAGAACLFASVRGIFRSRSFSARSQRRLRPAMRWWRSPPSRRRSLPRARWRFCIKPAYRRPRFICCPATAKSARASSPMRALPASASPARPRSARAINRALAAKNGPIVPLIAETGGINAMIVDATALPEQVIDDVITSAFRSAGQRCSALRLLCLQDDIAEPMLAMLVGAMRELKIGDPRQASTHVGPVIEAEAKQKLEGWIADMASAGRLRFQCEPPAELPAGGTYVLPALIELDRARELKEEVFGPVLHVVRWNAEELDALLDDIAANGTALTLGVHSRIDSTIERVAARLPHGNVYVNRSMIGAVVGTQPFGGTLLSGTGPKAGGPNYLRRFATEQVVTVNTAAAGGNAGLLALDD